MRRALLPEWLRMSVKRLLYRLLGWTPSEAVAGSRLERFGSRGAPWTVRTDLLGDSPSVISAGLSDDVEFENFFLKSYPGRLLALDPTPLSRLAAEQLIAVHGEDAVTFVPDALDGAEGQQSYLAELDPMNGEARYFYKEGSHPPLRESGDGVNAGPVFAVVQINSRTVAGLMRDHGLKQLDLLKLDIEGGEYAVIDSVLDAGLPIRQIAVEFHHRFKGIGLGATHRAISRLRKCGYDLQWVSEWGEEFLFVKA